jgi:hypothetical protein
MTRIATPAHRRHSLLATLYFEPASTASVLALVRQMALCHSLAVSSDLVRADLMWLDEMGLLRYRDDMAQLSERGRDVAQARAEFPGGLA